jgi:hypothetical protein
MREVTFNEWCEFSLANGPVTFHRAEPGHDGGLAHDGTQACARGAGHGLPTGTKSYLVNDAAKKGNRK